MALPLTIELIKSTRGKNKATLEGFAYTLTKSSVDVQQWVCEKRGVCKSRLHTKNNDVIMPKSLEEIHSSHTHGSDPARIGMIRGYNYVKERSFNSEESTRAILSNGIEQMSSSSIAQLPKLTSVKRTIRKCKSVSEIQIPQKYKVTLKDEPFLLYDSGYGDNNRMIIFSAPKFFSILKESNTWFADGTVKVVPEY